VELVDDIRGAEYFLEEVYGGIHLFQLLPVSGAPPVKCRAFGWRRFFL
jgi:hypothetical protein